MEHFPRDVSRRILERCKTSKAVVVVSKRGRPSRVYDLQAYLRRVEQTRTQRPWTHRKGKKTPDPLGAVDGKVIARLRRENIYD